MRQSVPRGDSSPRVQVCHFHDQISELYVHILPCGERLPRSLLVEVNTKIDKRLKKRIILSNVLEKTYESVLIREV